MKPMVRGPAGFAFNGLECGEEIEGGQICGEFDGGIEELRRAIRTFHRGGFIDFGAEKRAGVIVEGKKPPPAFLKVTGAIAEIGPQCDAGSHSNG